MKRIRTGSGPRVWFETEEIESITEGALRAAGLYPTDLSRAVDIESLLEVHLGATVDYAGDLPPSILGYTRFDTPPKVVVSRELTDLALAPGASLGLRGRWRATLAHEAAHILLHAGLAIPFGSTPNVTIDGIEALLEGQSTPDWRETQANMGMAALLMPRGPFLAEARTALTREPVFLPLAVESLQAERLVSILGHLFEASLEATRWRLRNLGWLTSAAIVGRTGLAGRSA